MPSADPARTSPTPSDLVFLHGRDFSSLKRPWREVGVAFLCVLIGGVLVAVGVVNRAVVAGVIGLLFLGIACLVLRSSLPTLLRR